MSIVDFKCDNDSDNHDNVKSKFVGYLMPKPSSKKKVVVLFNL